MAHFPYLSQSPHYAITALCNSSIECAQEAIKLHNLPPSTKAYAAPEDLAADPNVDLVVVSVKVSQHFRLVKPALLAGKDAFVEWPLGANLAEAEELLALAKEKGVRCVVGLEEAVGPGARGIKKIVEEGRIGRVLSSSVWGVGMYLGEAPVSARQAYPADVTFGGNLVTINTMHGALCFTRLTFFPILCRWIWLHYCDLSGLTVLTKRSTRVYLLRSGGAQNIHAPGCQSAPSHYRLARRRHEI